MITTNPFAELSKNIPSISMQLFVIVMIVLVIIGTFMDILHKKNILALRGSFRPVTKVNIDMLENGLRKFIENT